MDYKYILYEEKESSGILTLNNPEKRNALGREAEEETPTLEESREFCKPKMAPYKSPLAVEFLDEIPRLASGKALRRRLRETNS